MSDSTLSLLVLAGVIVLFVWNKLPVAAVAILTSLTLVATGLLPVQETLAGFGDPVVIFIAALFVVSEGIDSTGVTAWAGQALIRVAGEGRVRLTVAVMLLCAVLTALISLNGSVAALLPMVVVLASRIGQPVSRMLMPLAFAGSAGSLLALTGSPVNVIVSEASLDAGGPGFPFFSYALLGVPLLVGTVLIAVVLGPRVLPVRVPKAAPPDLSEHASTLTRQYGVQDGFYRLRVREQSPFVGSSPDALELVAYPGVTLIGAQADAAASSPVRGLLQAGDVLVVSGSADMVGRLAADQCLYVTMKLTGDDPLIGRDLGVAEVVVPPRSPLVGERVFPGMQRGPDLMILAVQRLGQDRGDRSTTIAVGDALLVQGSWPGIEALSDDRSVLVVDSPEMLRRQAVPLGPRSYQAIGVLVAMVVLLAFGWVPPSIAGLLAATAMVLLNVVGVEQAFRSISWETVVLIGGLIPLSVAITQSGAADVIARRLIDVVGPGRPYLLMLALFLLTGILGQVISNTATVLIIVPIALAAALETHTSFQPILMLVAVAGAASFLTPIATPANMMIMGPGGYRFADYWRLGLPVMVWWLVVSLVVIPLVWPF